MQPSQSSSRYSSALVRALNITLDDPDEEPTIYTVCLGWVKCNCL